MSPARLALTGASLGLSLLAAEGLYRAVVQHRYERQAAAFSAEPWQLVPESRFVFRLRADHAGRIPLGQSRRTVPYRTNPDGFRDAPRGAPRAGVLRVLVLGDSFDGHPNARAHERIAGILADRIAATP